MVFVNTPFYYYSTFLGNTCPMGLIPPFHYPLAGKMLHRIIWKAPRTVAPNIMQLDPITHVAKDARILIVDDAENNITALSQILGRAGYAICISITDGAEALAKFADIRPDLLLLDWHMEPISGLDFIQELKNRVPVDDMPPILVLTADISPETRREALAVGATDFLSKPLDASEVLLRIRNLLQMRLLHGRLQDSRHELETQIYQRTVELEQTLSELRSVQRQVTHQGPASEYP